MIIKKGIANIGITGVLNNEIQVPNVGKTGGKLNKGV
jgi:hypothetical protein